LNFGFTDAIREYFSRAVSLLAVAGFVGAVADVGGFAKLDRDFCIISFRIFFYRIHE
jgi:hypothetical protein